jgi:hypothetical protein
VLKQREGPLPSFDFFITNAWSHLEIVCTREKQAVIDQQLSIIDAASHPNTHAFF